MMMMMMMISVDNPMNRTFVSGLLIKGKDDGRRREMVKDEVNILHMKRAPLTFMTNKRQRLVT